MNVFDFILIFNNIVIVCLILTENEYPITQKLSGNKSWNRDKLVAFSILIHLGLLLLRRKIHYL